MKFKSIVSLLVFYLSINLGFSSDVIENWSCIGPKATLANFSITISEEDEELYPSIEEIVKIQKNCEAKKNNFSSRSEERRQLQDQSNKESAKIAEFIANTLFSRAGYGTYNAKLSSDHGIDGIHYVSDDLVCHNLHCRNSTVVINEVKFNYMRFNKNVLSCDQMSRQWIKDKTLQAVKLNKGKYSKKILTAIHNNNFVRVATRIKADGIVDFYEVQEEVCPRKCMALREKESNYFRELIKRLKNKFPNQSDTEEDISYESD